MKKRKLRGGIAVLSLTAALCLAQGAAVYAEEADDGSTFVTADPSKGIEYRYFQGSGSLEGIVLNGNSVVVKASPNSNGSDTWINIYNDKNRNGVVDDGEEAFEINGSADITVCPIFGVYGQKLTAPISITVDDVSLKNVWGVYEGAAEVAASETAVTITVKNGSTAYVVADAYKSTVKGNLKLEMSDSAKVSEVYSTMNSSVTGDIEVNLSGTASSGKLYGANVSDITGNVEINTSSSNVIERAYGSNASVVDGNVTVNAAHSDGGYGYLAAVDSMKSTDVEYAVKGNVYMNVNGANITTIYGVTNNAVVDGDVTMKAKNTAVDSMYAASSGTVDGNVDAAYEGLSCKNSYSSMNLYGANASKVSGGLKFDAKNIVGKISYIYGGFNTDIDGAIDIDIDGQGTEIGNIYGLNGGTIKGSTDIRMMNCKITSNFYGIQGSTMLQEEPENEDAYANVLRCENIDCKGYTFFVVSGAANQGSTHVIMNNVSAYNTMSVIYNQNVIAGRINVEMTDCTSQYGYIMNGYNSSSTVNSEVQLKLTDSVFEGHLYMLYNNNCLENVSIDVENIVSNGLNVATYSTCLKNLDVKLLYANDPATLDDSGNPVVDSYSNAGKGSFDLLYSTVVAGDLNGDISNIHYASCGLAGGSSSGGMSGKNTDIELKNSSFATTNSNATVYLLNEYTYSSDTLGDTFADIKIKNCDFTGMAGATFKAYANSHRRAAISFDEECKLPDGYYFCPSSNTKGYITITYGGDLYYGGDEVIIDKDVTADNIYFGNGQSGKTMSGACAKIAAGATVTAQEGIYISSSANVLCEGTLNGTFKQLDGASYIGSLYMNGGKVTDENVYDCAHVYYPITVVNNDKAAIVQNPGVTSQLDENTYFACIDSELIITPALKKGYILEKVVYRVDGETQDNEADVDGSSYKFTMPNKACTVTVVTKGKQIRTSKTKPDPSAILGHEYTAEDPLYDMADITIFNDGAEGTVTYEVDKDYTLPEGLSLVDGKITGTSNTPYEDGKKVVIYLTGKNGSKTQVTLNVIVSKEQKIQDNTDGRIQIDEENKKIILDGTSVVIQAGASQVAEDGAEDVITTEIYIDDNKDGAADGKTPLCSGDLSEYTVVGVEDNEFSRSIRITMLGGKLKALYGAANSEITYDGGDAVAVVIKGGHVDESYALVNTPVTGTVAYEIAKDCSDKGDIASGSASKYTGALYRTTGDYVVLHGKYTVSDKITAAGLTIYDDAEVVINAPVEVSGSVSVDDDASVVISGTISANSLAFYRYGKAEIDGDAQFNTLYMINNSGQLTIGEGSTFDVKEVKITDSWSKVYQKGTLNCPSDKFTNKGTWVMAGKLAEGVDSSAWDGVYYHIASCSTNMSGAAVSVSNQGYTMTYEKEIYAKGGASISVKYTNVPGYTAYISINGGEPVKGINGTASLVAEKCNMDVTADYVADQISAAKNYADPVIVAGTEYTAENPAYDLTGLNVTGDTTTAYGSDMQYRVKSGSKLPVGLELAGGKITGKASAAGDTDVTFVVTGRNGTTVDVDIKFTVLSAGTKVPDINDMITDATTSKIDLGGTSVVIIADPANSAKTAIYLDADHDGIADNNRALKIAGETSYNLSTCKIYGYTDGDNAYNGDISITLRSGIIGALYGAGSTDKNAARVTVDGSVSVKVLGGTVKTETYGVCNADVTTVNFDAEDGKLYKQAYGAYNSQIQNMNFAFVNKAKMYADDNYSNTGTEKLYVTNGGSVAGDVNAKVGALTSEEPFAYGKSNSRNVYAYFYGVNGTPVSGNVNYTVEGNWYIGRLNTMINESDVDGDLNVELKSGYIGGSMTNDYQRSFVLGNLRNKIRNVKVRSATEGEVSGNFVLTAGVVVNDIYFNDVTGKTTGTVTGISTSSQVTHNGAMFIKTKNDLTLGGTYTVDENIETTTLSILADANVTITDGVTVNHSGAADIKGNVENNGTWTSDGNFTLTGIFVNRGTWNINKYAYFGDSGSIVQLGYVDNYGTVKTVSSKTARTYIYANSKFINRENASYEFGYISNLGSIVNYGDLKENYYNGGSAVGTVFTTTAPDFKYKMNNYSGVYYKVDAEYPAYCFKDGDAKIQIAATNTNYQKSSGIDGDDNVYIAGNMGFYVNVEGEPIDGMKIDSVVYGSAESSATTSDNVKWSGTVAYEPTHAVINMAKQEAENITLAKTEDTVSAQVGKSTYASDPLYDLTKIEIQNDDVIENGYVAYSLVKGQTLPDGLVMSGGKIYGTPKKATDEAQTVVFSVRGQNQTIAEFTLTIEKIEKGIPVLGAADAGSAYAGNTLESVALPTSSQGVYSWADSTQAVGKAGTSESYDAYFVPNDTANYDWSKLDAASGTYELLEDGSVRINVKLTVYVRKQDPVYTVPTGVTAVYGDTVGKVIIPETEDGMFIWENADESVGEVGTKTFLATFVPADEDVYERAEHIEIEVEVKPAPAEFTQAIETLTAKENSTLADIELPDRDDGIYTWYTDRSTQVVDGEFYKLCFKPDDTKNYDWTAVTGWNRAYRGVVFPVKVEIQKEHVHDYGEDYVNDATNHWHECTCGDVIDKAAHTWDSGKISTAPTDTKAGKKVYACTVCGYRRYETIKAKGKDLSNATYNVKITGVNTSAVYTGKAITFPKLAVTSNRTKLVVGKDYKVTYKNNNRIGTATIKITGMGSYRGEISTTFKIVASKTVVYTVTQPTTKVVYKYKITNTATGGKGSVALVGVRKLASDKKYTKLIISDTVAIGGVTFKVTSIGTKAFKGYKYLKVVAGGKNVTRIDQYAFNGCKALTAISSFDNVTSIGSYAFNGCKLLKTMPVKKNLKTIGAYAFCGCTALNTLSIGSKVTTIGMGAFYKCTALKTLSIGSKVTTIGTSAFSKCTALKSVTIGNNVTTIGKNAFAGCTKLDNVQIGLKVKTIGESAFSGCKSLKSVKIASTKLKTVGKYAFKNTYSTIKFKITKTKYTNYSKLIKAKAVAAPAKAVYSRY